MAMHTCPSCQTTFEVKALVPGPGEHHDYQPPSLPGSQTPVPPGHAFAAMDGPTREHETAIEAEPQKEWKALDADPDLEPVEDDDEPDEDTPAGEHDSSLFEEVEGKGFVPFKKGGGTADKAGDGGAKVARGEYVSWSGGKGRVDLVVIAGVVPGVKSAKPVFGSKASPAARVVVYAKSGSGWKATAEKVAAKASDLTKIDPLTADGK